MATTALNDEHKKALRQEFDTVVNMSASQLEKWLKTNESKSVGQKNESDSESIGHKSGEHIITILEKRSGDLSDDDYAHMSKVISYVKRHSAQRPAHVANSNWT